METRFTSAGAERNCSPPMRVPDPSLFKNLAPMDPEILFSAGAGVCRKVRRHFQTPVLPLEKENQVSSLRTVLADPHP